MSRKLALIIGNTEYNDPGLAKLTAPGKDAVDFARVLKDKDICAFDEVRVLTEQPESVIREAIDEFFDQKKPDDLLILYFSGHGVRDEVGALYLAAKNTNRFRLRSTAIKSDYIREVMDHSRSNRQILILDCCNSGAFAQGTKAATGGTMGLVAAFDSGYGRIILTATDATQFAWEGDKVIGETDKSLFTHFLVKGLEGEADYDGDGRITVDELYDYAYEKVRLVTPKQTPSKFSTRQQGEIVLRQMTRLENSKPMPLSDDLLREMEDDRPYVREAAVLKLGKLLRGKNMGQARAAKEALEKFAENDDSRRVSQAAREALAALQQRESIIKEAEKIIEESSMEEERTRTSQQINGEVNESQMHQSSVPSIPVPEASKKKTIQKNKPFSTALLPIGIAGVVFIFLIAYGAFRYIPAIFASNSPTVTPTPSFTPSQTVEPVPTLTVEALVPVTDSCTQLLTPENNAEVPTIGKINFTWKPVPGAASYVLEIILPNGSAIPFSAEDTAITRYAESTPLGGNYQWKVFAYDADGKTICHTDLFQYSKSAYAKPQSGGGGSGGSVPPSPTVTP